MARRSLTPIDVGLVVALAWLMAALGVTVLFGPSLGLRGWAWLGLHHVLCLVGTSHELWRAWGRRKARLAALAAAPPPPPGSA